ncbi:MAG: TlpA family protein disulfide reductase [Sedimenticola sp.]|nr:TlpA family protein disulfide reductase [Sedimenticola sp.]
MVISGKLFILSKVKRMELFCWIRRLIGCTLLLFATVMTGHTDPLAAYKMRHYQLQEVADRPLAPAFSLMNVTGKSSRLEDYRGQVVVINFWSTWCAPCRKEMPSLERAWQQLQSDNVVVLGIAIQDEQAMVVRFIEESRITFPILLDTEGTVAQSWPFSGIPATFVLDASGRIIYRALGLREWDSEAILQKVRALAGEDQQIKPFSATDIK